MLRMCFCMAFFMRRFIWLSLRALLARLIPLILSSSWGSLCMVLNRLFKLRMSNSPVFYQIWGFKPLLLIPLCLFSTLLMAPWSCSFILMIPFLLAAILLYFHQLLLLYLRNLISRIWENYIIFWGCRFPIYLLVYLCLKLIISSNYWTRLICRIRNLVLLLVFLIITCLRLMASPILIRSNTWALWEPCSISLSQGLILLFQWIKLASSCIIPWSLML